MNPLFVYPHVLLKQYGDSLIYKWTDYSMEYEGLNKTGAEILELCDGETSVNQIAQVSLYGIRRNSIKQKYWWKISLMPVPAGNI